MGEYRLFRKPPAQLTLALSNSEKVYLAPSGVQKERIEPQDIFVLTLKVRFSPNPFSFFPFGN